MFRKAICGLLISSLLCGPLLAADNFGVLNGSGSPITKRSKDVGAGVQADLNGLLDTSNAQIDPATAGNQASTNTKLDTLHTDLTAATPAGENQLGFVSVPAIVASGTLSMVSSATAYTALQVIGASTTAGNAGNVVQLPVCRVNGGKATIRSMSLFTSAADAGMSGQTVNIQIYRDAPTLTNGDHGAYLTTESGWKNVYPVILAQHFSNAEKGRSAPIDTTMSCPTGQNFVYAVLQAGTSFTPSAGSLTLTLVAEVEAR